MKSYRVKSGSKIDLGHWDADDTGDFGNDKDKAREKLVDLNRQLAELQEVLYAEHKHKVLIVLQAMDTGGKDGTIRNVFAGVNPQGVRVANFKAPTPDELDHDFLWRVHQHVPGKGEIVIFNRSHYEDVLIVRVHGLAPRKVWSRRYDHINDFERMLADEGTTIVKFFLHIGPDEQKKRLQARLDDPKKYWKFNSGDLKELALWPEYSVAYEDAIARTSSDHAPWHIVPANRKWYRNWVVASVIVETLKDLNMRYPEPKEDLTGVTIE